MNREKKDFILGIAVSVAVVAVIALVILAVAYVQKTADPVKDSAQAEVKKAPAPTPAPTPTPSKPTSGKVSIKVDEDDHIRGNKDAKITIVEFSDYQCPYCARFHTTLEKVMENYPDEVRWVYKHFPLDSIHPYARKAAEASECAGEQNKFWEYNDKLFANQSSINIAYLSTVAKELKLDTKKFDKCLADGTYAKKVDDDFQYGKKLGVTGTPGAFLNGQKLGGAVPYEQLEAMIEELR